MRNQLHKTAADAPTGLNPKQTTAWLKGVNEAIDASNARPERILGEAPEYLTRRQALEWALED
jgi:hypothetical protein